MVCKGVLILLGFLFGVFLYINDPAQIDLVPRCRFKSIIGLSCPACEIQRCVYVLLHGDYVSAIKYNLFFLGRHSLFVICECC